MGLVWACCIVVGLLWAWCGIDVGLLLACCGLGVGEGGAGLVWACIGLVWVGCGLGGVSGVDVGSVWVWCGFGGGSVRTRHSPLAWVSSLWPCSCGLGVCSVWIGCVASCGLGVVFV